MYRIFSLGILENSGARYPDKLLLSSSLKKFQKYVITATGGCMNKTEHDHTVQFY